MKLSSMESPQSSFVLDIFIHLIRPHPVSGVVIGVDLYYASIQHNVMSLITDIE